MDDASAALLDHVAAEGLACAEGPMQVDVEDVQPRFVRDIERGLPLRYAGGVYQDVYLSKSVCCLVQQGLDRRTRLDIDTDFARSSAERADF